MTCSTRSRLVEDIGRRVLSCLAVSLLSVALLVSAPATITALAQNAGPASVADLA